MCACVFVIILHVVVANVSHPRCLILQFSETVDWLAARVAPVDGPHPGPRPQKRFDKVVVIVVMISGVVFFDNQHRVSKSVVGVIHEIF